MNKKGCGKSIDALGYVKCGDEIRENSIPQGKYFKCSDCRDKGYKNATCEEVHKRLEQNIKLSDHNKLIKEVKDKIRFLIKFIEDECNGHDEKGWEKVQEIKREVNK